MAGRKKFALVEALRKGKKVKIAPSQPAKAPRGGTKVALPAIKAGFTGGNLTPAEKKLIQAVKKKKKRRR